jgi:hypothetical protein
MSENPSHPQGVSMWSEYPAYQMAIWRTNKRRNRIRWLNLPEYIRKHVIARAEEY